MKRYEFDDGSAAVVHDVDGVWVVDWDRWRASGFASESLAHRYVYVVMGDSTPSEEGDSVAIGCTSGLTWDPLSRARQAGTDGAEGSEQ